MIAYLDSSVLARVYLSDEPGHRDACALLENEQLALITGTWTRIEVSGTLVRAARTGRGDTKGLLALLDVDLAERVAVLSAPQEQIETSALVLVRDHGLRAMDAWHLAVAALTVPALTEPGEEIAFASRDAAQRTAAAQLGFITL